MISKIVDTDYLKTRLPLFAKQAFESLNGVEMDERRAVVLDLISQQFLEELEEVLNKTMEDFATPGLRGKIENIILSKKMERLKETNTDILAIFFMYATLFCKSYAMGEKYGPNLELVFSKEE